MKEPPPDVVSVRGRRALSLSFRLVSPPSMRFVLALCLAAVLALAGAASPRAQANAEATVHQGERPARALLARAGLVDTTATPAEVPIVEAPRPMPVAAPIDPTPLLYVIERGAPLRAAPDAGAAVVERLEMREGVRHIGAAAPHAEGWVYVRHGDAEGYVREADVSNVWLRVDKSERTLYLYRGAELVRTFPADVSASEGDKVRRSDLGETEHYRIPEGTFFVVGLNAASSYYKAFVINYPNTAHAERGLRDGIITPFQFEAIAAAERNVTAPPMGTRLGGLIEIHGSGSGRQRAWTRGCVALRNIHMDDLWDIVHVGTPVVVEP